MELAILNIIMACFLISWIVFLILMSVFSIVIRYLPRNTVVLVILRIIFYLIYIFLCIWVTRGVIRGLACILTGFI